MDKIDFTKQFSYRLRDAMIAAGYRSQRSPSGVNIDKLAEITGYSPQICRKYLRGEALPDPTKLMELAAKLHVAPGWLLFGYAHNDPNTPDDSITINKKLLQYIFTGAASLYQTGQTEHDIPDFLLSLAYDISQINATEEQSKKIIDLAISSAKHFIPL